MNIQFWTVLALFWTYPLILIGQDENGLRNQKVCERLTVRSEADLSFSDTEKQLICDGVGKKAWMQIPIAQKKYLIRNFLQARAYHDPVFTVSGDELIVQTGELSRLRKIELIDNTIGLDPTRFWKAYGRPMTPKALDELEQWILTQYGREGYVCAKLKSRAYPLESRIEVDIWAGELKPIMKVKSENIPGIVAGTERRYDAFQIGETLDSQDLQLSAKRAMDDEFVVSTSYTTECKDEGILIKQRFMPGEPRLVSFGIGFDTEEYAITEARWKNTRFTEMASSLDAFFRASYRKIQLQMGFDWYYAPIVMRHNIRSEIELVRENEDNFESRSFSIKTGPSWFGDRSHYSYTLWPHISLQNSELVRGEGPAKTKQVRLALKTSMQSHDFEYYLSDPRTGYAMGFLADTSQQGGGSDISVSRFFYDATYYHNLWNLDPAVWILGLRTKLATIIDGKKTRPEDIPANQKLRLGGVSDIRGFPRQQVGEEGAFTTAYVGGELRINNSLPYGLQPIFLIDAAKIGSEPTNLDSSLYWSPGFGVHWATFIGAIRTTVAYGFAPSDANDDLGGWQFYVSLGEQF